MKWGIMATGNIANKFAKTINMMKDAGEDQELVACASRSLEKAKQFAETYGIEKAYGSYEEMLEDTEVEVVYIATPNNFHYENCKACLNAGKHVLCEKPFTVDAGEAAKLYELAKEKGLFIMEGFWIRFLPALQKMQEIIKSGEIGDVMFARSDYGFIAKGARRVRKFAPELAGGALLDIGIYNLGFMRMVMGDTNPVNYNDNYHLSEFGTDDFSTIMMQYPNGASAHILTSIGMDFPRNAAVLGTKGSIYLDDFQHADHLQVEINEGENYELDFPIEYGGFEYEIREVSQCIAAGKNTSDVLKSSDTIDVIAFMQELLNKWR